MNTPLTGIVRNGAIILDRDLQLPDGTKVSISVHPLDPAAANAQAMSSQRPMSPEERAELEAVYQERGCGIECDPD